MKIITFHSETYAEMFYEIFAPSVPDSMVLESHKIPPRFAKYTYGHSCTADFNKWVYPLVQGILDDARAGEVLCFTGVDRQFYSDCTGRMLSLMGDSDICTELATAKDGPFCNDFKLFRVSDKLRSFTRDVMRAVLCQSGCNDMQTFNDMLRKPGHDLKLSLLPKNEFWNTYGLKFPWNGDVPSPPLPPREIKSFHAYAASDFVRHKVRLMRAVSDLVKAGRFAA